MRHEPPHIHFLDLIWLRAVLVCELYALQAHMLATGTGLAACPILTLTMKGANQQIPHWQETARPSAFYIDSSLKWQGDLTALAHQSCELKDSRFSDTK